MCPVPWAIMREPQALPPMWLHTASAQASAVKVGVAPWGENQEGKPCGAGPLSLSIQQTLGTVVTSNEHPPPV